MTRRVPVAVLVVAALFALPIELVGQDQASEVPATGVAPLHAAPANPDFLFGRPNVTLSLRGGMFLNRGASEIHDFAIDHLTLERSDFRAGSGGIEAGVWTGDRLELVIGGDWSEVTLPSEVRRWEEENGDPIRQSTRLRHGPAVTGGIKAYAFPRGEALSRFAWTPRRANLFAGAGIGWTGYEFEQWGDFVDEEQELIFTADITSSGSAFSAYTAAGFELSVSTRASIITEARYLWARTELSRDFDFYTIDLSGLRLTAGLGFRI